MLRSRLVILLVLACGCGRNYDAVDSFADCHQGMPRAVTDVSDCPPDNLCCHDNWPFGDTSEGGGADNFVYAVGDEPWDREREMNLAVTLDPALQVGAASRACTGAISTVGVTPCDGVDHVYAHDLDTPAIEIDAPGNLYGDFLLIEVDRADTGSLRARACFDGYTDVGGPQCEPGTVRCAASGTVTLASTSPSPTVRA